MLDVQNRLPTPGKENRVKITQDSGAVVEGVLSYADDATQDGTFWNRKNGQLLQGDIRELTIKDGESISAGDVVNVDGGVYHDVTPQANVENVAYYATVKATDICFFSEQYSLFVMSTDKNDIVVCWIYNLDGKIYGSPITVYTGVDSINVRIEKIDDTHIFVGYSYGSIQVAHIGTISNMGISFSAQYLTALGNSVAEFYNDILLLSQTISLSIYNSSGLKCKVLPISGTTITTSGTVYSLSGNTGANHISACKLPDDSNGNKRVCICFSDTGDGNKGKAVIATISSSNVVTFGSLLTFSSYNTLCTSCDILGNDIIVAYTADVDGQKLLVCSISLENNDIIGVSETFTVGTATAIFLSLSVLAGKIVVLYTNTNGISIILDRNDGSFALKSSFDINDSAIPYVSSSVISNNKILSVYADHGNSNYGTTTILTVEDNQIAGSFIDNSKDAIALASGSGGDIIPVGFGGYCQCDGVTEGQQILSDGVSAFSPLDGWLYLLGAGMKKIGTQIVTGSYIGTGIYGANNPTSLTFDFAPQVVCIHRRTVPGSVTQSINFLIPRNYSLEPGENATWTIETYSTVRVTALSWSDDGKTLSWSAASATNQLNDTGEEFWYYAIG